jgi:hypothetical protein
MNDRVCRVEVDYAVYNTIKKGALLNLAAADLAALSVAANLLYELDAFRYDWKPACSPSQTAIQRWMKFGPNSRT